MATTLHNTAKSPEEFKGWIHPRDAENADKDVFPPAETAGRKALAPQQPQEEFSSYVKHEAAGGQEIASISPLRGRVRSFCFPPPQRKEKEMNSAPFASLRCMLCKMFQIGGKTL